jgi:hypothetical protein
MESSQDLFAKLHDPNAGALTDAERKRIMARLKERKTGHAWKPGTGPHGETCASCKHLVRKRMGKTYLKCGLMKAQWTGGYGTDVKARDPACKKWETNNDND